MAKSIDKHEEVFMDITVSTQAELKRNIPDGGYGWIIVLVAAFLQGVIPSLSAGYGILILFWRLENNTPSEPNLWDNKIVHTSLLFVAVSTALESWCRKLAIISTWPRLVITSGTCLTCAGLLVIWLAINNSKENILFILAGALSGIGASIVLSQIDIIISQYFCLKLEPVKVILDAARALGFILTPVALGHNIVNLGILQVITWYQAVILQGLLVAIVIKKPKYLKSAKSKYQLVRGMSEDEEDIFAKNVTELQSPRQVVHSEANNIKVEADVEAHSTNSKQTSNSVNHANWETFENDTTDVKIEKSKTQIYLHNAFAKDLSNDLNRIDNCEDNSSEFPSPLFSETTINNNISYSYEPTSVISDPVVFMPVDGHVKIIPWKEKVDFLKRATFYKSLLSLITVKYSLFVFWTLYPTYIYSRVDHLRVHHATVIVGCTGIGCLLFTTFAACIKAYTNLRAVFLCIFCWMGAIGYITLANATNEATIIFAGIDITLSLGALQMLVLPLLNLNMLPEVNYHHMALTILTGITLIVMFGISMTYYACFQVIGILHLLCGSLWLSNVIYKRIKKNVIQNN